ncbi:MAG: VWA domain-containing protein [Acidobacteriota bacterium]
MKINLLVCVFLVMSAMGSAMAQTAPPAVASTEAETAAEPGVFHGEVEVSVVTLYATVVDRKGKTISGLKADDFAVFEGGEAREITLFEAVDRTEVEVTTLDAQPEADEAPVPEIQTRGDSVAVVFDNTRLERRARRRVLKALEEMVEPMWAQGAEVMVGVMAPRFEAIQDFGRDPELFAAALEQVGDTPTTGDAIKSERRALKRDVNGGLAAGSQNFEAMEQGEAMRLELRIDAFRELEMQRGLEGLNRLESLVRSLAGRGGRTSLIWVTEDMSFRPTTDIYRRFFNRFSGFVTLDLPEIWGLERDLQGNFDRVIAAAQSAGVTVHVVDASDRDSEVMDTDFRTPDVATRTVGNASGRVSTTGYDFSEVYDAIEGSQYLGYGSGGDFFGNSRNFEVFVDSFVETTATYYVIGYDRPAPSDGQTHSVRLEVKRPGLRVRHPAKILDRTPEQRLTDSVVSHLVWGEGTNPLGLFVRVDEKQETEGGEVLWPVNLEIPAVALLPGDDGRALITVVICVGSADGTMSAPHQFRLVLPVPKDNPLAVGTAQVTLSTRPEGNRVAVGIRDELSGATSTVLEPLTPGSQASEP